MIQKKQVFLSSSNDLIPLGEVRTDTSVQDIKYQVFLETGLDPRIQSLTLNGKELEDQETLNSARVQESDVLIITPRVVNPYVNPNSNSNGNRNTSRAPSVTAPSTSEEMEFNPDVQRRMEELIRLQNIQQNMEYALEYNPESFASVTMLYVDAEINGVPMKAFVDSGAQTTILSLKCAEKCGLLRLLDRRFSGLAKGVGSARILGKIHMAPLKLGKTFFQCSFTVLDSPDMEFLLGLDMLRKFQANIDLKENVLKIGDEKIPFLAEKDLFESPVFGSSNSRSSPVSKLNEEAIKQLVNMGFQRNDAIKALQNHNGNLELAAISLANLGA